MANRLRVRFGGQWASLLVGGDRAGPRVDVFLVWEAPFEKLGTVGGQPPDRPLGQYQGRRDAPGDPQGRAVPAGIDDEDGQGVHPLSSVVMTGDRDPVLMTLTPPARVRLEFRNDAHPAAAALHVRRRVVVLARKP